MEVDRRYQNHVVAILPSLSLQSISAEAWPTRINHNMKMHRIKPYFLLKGREPAKKRNKSYSIGKLVLHYKWE